MLINPHDPRRSNNFPATEVSDLVSKFGPYLRIINCSSRKHLGLDRQVFLRKVIHQVRKGSLVESTQPWAWGGPTAKSKPRMPGRPERGPGRGVHAPASEPQQAWGHHDAAMATWQNIFSKPRPWLSSHPQKRSRVWNFFQVGPGVPDCEDLA